MGSGMKNLTGQSIGRYQVLESLGQGGMAEVYRAYDPRLERHVAMKFIRGDTLNPAILDKLHKRFEREAKVLALLDHPHIVAIIEYGEYDHIPYLVMPLMAGGTLRSVMGMPMGYADAAQWLLPIAQALAYAHRRKIIHRDIKPSNILLTATQEPMLSDFGIVKILEDETHDLTGSGSGLGTPDYMAPEQVQNKNVDQRSDIYSLGIIFYECVTGRRPFQGTTPVSIAVKHITEQLLPPSRFVPNLPRSVEWVITTALAKRPEERFLSTDEMVGKLELLAQGRAEEIRVPTLAVVLETASGDSQRNLTYEKALPAVPLDIKSSLKIRRGLMISGVTAAVLLVLGGIGFAAANLNNFFLGSAASTTPSTPVAVSHIPTSISTSPNATATPDPTPPESPTPTIPPIPASISLQNADQLTPLASISLPDPNNSCSSNVAFSPDHSLIASQYQNLLMLYNTSDGSKAAVNQEHKEALDGVLFSPDGKTVASSDCYGAQIWGVASGEKLSIPPDRGQCQALNIRGLFYGGIATIRRTDALSYAPDESLLVEGYGSEVNIWDMGKLVLLNTYHHQNIVLHTIFSADGNLVASASEDNNIIIWDVEEAKILDTLLGHSDRIMDIIFSPDGKTMASFSQKDALLWDVSSGNLLGRLNGMFEYAWRTGIFFSPDSQYLYAAAQDGNLAVFEVANRKISRSLPVGLNAPGSFSHLELSPDSQFMVSYGANNDVLTYWDLNTGSPVRQFTPQKTIMCDVAFSQDSKMMASVTSGEILLWGFNPQ
jgi:serine/threonine protein kinase